MTLAATISALTGRYGRAYTLRRNDTGASRLDWLRSGAHYTWLRSGSPLYWKRAAGLAVTPADQPAAGRSWEPVTPDLAYLPAFGRQRHYKPGEIRGTIQERDLLITLDPAASVKPREGDMIAPGVIDAAGDTTLAQWWQVVNVYAPEIGATEAVYKVQVRR